MRSPNRIPTKTGPKKTSITKSPPSSGLPGSPSTGHPSHLKRPRTHSNGMIDFDYAPAHRGSYDGD